MVLQNVWGRTIMDRTRALLFEAGLPDTFWNFAVMTATYIINRSPTSALPNNKTPFEMLNEDKPSYNDLQIFGCVAYSKMLPSGSKLNSKSEKCIFLGYTHNGYKLLDLTNKRVIVARDVVFDPNTLFKDLTEFEKKSILFDSTKLNYITTLNYIPTPINKNEDTIKTQSTISEPIKDTIFNLNKNQISGSSSVEVSNEIDVDKLISNYENNDATVMLVDDSDVPKSYADIKNHPNSEKWYQAAIKELNALKAKYNLDTL